MLFRETCFEENQTHSILTKCFKEADYHREFVQNYVQSCHQTSDNDIRQAALGTVSGPQPPHLLLKGKKNPSPMLLHFSLVFSHLETPITCSLMNINRDAKHVRPSPAFCHRRVTTPAMLSLLPLKIQTLIMKPITPRHDLSLQFISKAKRGHVSFPYLPFNKVKWWGSNLALLDLKQHWTTSNRQ